MVVHVAVALIEDAQRRVLLSRRHDHLHQGGLWEFPGGKRESGESLADALVREIDEELGIRVLGHRPLIQVHHDYGDRRVLLDVQRVLRWEGKPSGREGQALAWVDLDELHHYPMPAADRPIISAARLPDRYLVATLEGGGSEAYLKRLRRALDAGVRLVQFRQRNCSGELLEAAATLCKSYGAELLVSSGLGIEAPSLGLHLTSADLMAAKTRPAVEGWVGASCHDPVQLDRAAALGLDFAVLSPVLPTPSHPDATPLGWERFSHWVSAARLPVYALGGVGELAPALACDRGAQGVAGIRGLW